MKLCGRGWSPAGLRRQLSRLRWAGATWLVGLIWGASVSGGGRDLSWTEAAGSGAGSSWVAALPRPGLAESSVLAWGQLPCLDQRCLDQRCLDQHCLGLGLGLASFGLGLAFLSQLFVVFGLGTGLLLLPGSLCSRGQGLVGFLLLLGQVVGVVASI